MSLMMMHSNHLLPAGAIIKSYSQPSNPDQSEDGVIYIDTAEYYLARMKAIAKKEAIETIDQAKIQVMLANRILQEAEYAYWKIDNPNGTWFEYFMSLPEG